ncbi:putative sigma-54 interacting protein [Acetobacter aceti NRIC 0242]|uniref:Sigma-54-dependent Fis family transcriptional regulator n=1 Tax=Acetobacter aceti NBRC 14818 TaxID=887700 RepID=A0AB33IH08_ACEAC|nr:sigma-54 dependent transcriptional regulator [Acetobacter aceti]TCS32033.1 two component Fis family sigma54 specific transcriptional regulator [Acetobacter aceti NBRC 14818]BCK77338.1 sigma-54-dependent Fis family transcriptional regulator [Acetobacter aceti NBRC 14818]GAN58975.1 two component transcriptional regulator sigma54 specific Fis/NtrC/NtrX [Acetobacter aceti NBRC 14818]GBO81693.1 putative sigma-54 interacting protein [Acetobacter aceti NRIC 0242]
MRILIIGSLSDELGKATKIVLARGACVDHAETNGYAIKKICSSGDYKFIICSVRENITDLIKALKQERIAIPVIACGPEDPAIAADAIANGAEDYIPLPPDPDIIAAFLQDASSEKTIFHTVDPVMKKLLKQVDKIAVSGASVLVTGESGTGKEIIARYIYLNSKRATGPFIALNCAALPETLVESELFGHERGAFSGATARRVGRFEAANHGTLLLDEISEMDVRLQAKLLRAIQEREIDRLGGNTPVSVDVRIIATSNRDLPAEIKAQKFREDLYFRLNVVSIRIPPLRDRVMDIPYLANHFCLYYSKINAIPQKTISESAMEKLKQYKWPGNVRELENTVHRAVVVSSNDIIDVDCFDLPDAQSEKHSQEHSLSSWVGYRMDEVEQALIIETLSHTDGNRTQAASILGISIRALRNKLREYAGQGVAVPPPYQSLTEI